MAEGGRLKGVGGGRARTVAETCRNGVLTGGRVNIHAKFACYCSGVMGVEGELLGLSFSWPVGWACSRSHSKPGLEDDFASLCFLFFLSLCMLHFCCGLF